MLDADRADLDARHALHARPERLRPDRVPEDRGLRVEERRHVERRADPERSLRDLAQVEDEIARRERVTGGGGRAGVVALAALRAGVELEEMLGRERGDRRVADLLGLRVRRDG